MTLYLLEEDGSRTETESWTSGDEPYYIEELIVGRTYVLEETVAPDGYLQTQEITFTVPESGEIQTVIMKDEMLWEKSPSVAGGRRRRDFPVGHRF